MKLQHPAHLNEFSGRNVGTLKKRLQPWERGSGRGRGSGSGRGTGRGRGALSTGLKIAAAWQMLRQWSMQRAGERAEEPSAERAALASLSPLSVCLALCVRVPELVMYWNYEKGTAGHVMEREALTMSHESEMRGKTCVERERAWEGGIAVGSAARPHSLGLGLELSYMRAAWSADWMQSGACRIVNARVKRKLPTGQQHPEPPQPLPYPSLSLSLSSLCVWAFANWCNENVAYGIYIIYIQNLASIWLH